jgi:hypothetical protein
VAVQAVVVNNVVLPMKKIMFKIKKGYKATVIIVMFLTGVFIGYFVAMKVKANFKSKSFEQQRAEILSKMDIAIEKAEKDNRYECCIEPPCKMCFLGHWIWKDGSCYCDDMIKENKLNFVCPECLRGIKEGRCESEIGSCQITIITINSSEMK